MTDLIKLLVTLPDSEDTLLELNAWLRESSCRVLALPVMSPDSSMKWWIRFEVYFEDEADALEFFMAWHGTKGVKIVNTP